MEADFRYEIVESPPWEELDRLPDRTVFQTKAWIDFVALTQNASPVIARFHERDSTLGYFTGLIIRKWGLKILGSPFPGWTTSYMGFNLRPGVSRGAVLETLSHFAFKKLNCVHFELMDRHLTLEDSLAIGDDHRIFSGFEIDLSQSEDELFARFTSACRRCIRKAEKAGVTIQEAHDDLFADDYYAQLQDVFAKQSLVPTYPIERVRELIRQVHPTGRLLLLRARDQEERCIATGIFPAMNKTMYFWGGASWRQFQMSRPNELIQWYAMKYWKKQGTHRYDMGGGGDYKRKYGGYEIAVPWIRKSRYPFMSQMRNMAQYLYTYRQRLLGRLQ